MIISNGLHGSRHGVRIGIVGGETSLKVSKILFLMDGKFHGERCQRAEQRAPRTPTRGHFTVYRAVRTDRCAALLRAVHPGVNLIVLKAGVWLFVDMRKGEKAHHFGFLEKCVFTPRCQMETNRDNKHLVGCHVATVSLLLWNQMSCPAEPASAVRPLSQAWCNLEELPAASQCCRVKIGGRLQKKWKSAQATGFTLSQFERYLQRQVSDN